MESVREELKRERERCRVREVKEGRKRWRV